MDYETAISIASECDNCILQIKNSKYMFIKATTAFYVNMVPLLNAAQTLNTKVVNISDDITKTINNEASNHKGLTSYGFASKDLGGANPLYQQASKIINAKKSYQYGTTQQNGNSIQDIVKYKNETLIPLIRAAVNFNKTYIEDLIKTIDNKISNNNDRIKELEDSMVPLDNEDNKEQLLDNNREISNLQANIQELTLMKENLTECINKLSNINPEMFNTSEDSYSIVGYDSSNYQNGNMYINVDVLRNTGQQISALYDRILTVANNKNEEETLKGYINSNIPGASVYKSEIDHLNSMLTNCCGSLSTLSVNTQNTITTASEVEQNIISDNKSLNKNISSGSSRKSSAGTTTAATTGATAVTTVTSKLSQEASVGEPTPKVYNKIKTTTTSGKYKTDDDKKTTDKTNGNNDTNNTSNNDEGTTNTTGETISLRVDESNGTLSGTSSNRSGGGYTGGTRFTKDSTTMQEDPLKTNGATSKTKTANIKLTKPTLNTTTSKVSKTIKTLVEDESGGNGSLAGAMLGIGALGAAGVAGARYLNKKKEEQDDYSDDEDYFEEKQAYTDEESIKNEETPTTKYKAGTVNSLKLDDDVDDIKLDDSDDFSSDDSVLEFE